MKQYLVERFAPEKVDEEIIGNDFYFRAIVARADRENANGRTYPANVLFPAFEQYLQRADEKPGLVNHPEGAEGVIENIGILWKEFTFDAATGFVRGYGKIISTAKGLDLRRVIEAGIKVGFSTRGYGTVENGTVVSFDLLGVDAVITPSVDEARVEVEQMEDEQTVIVERAAFEGEKAAFEEAKAAFEGEKAAFNEERAAFEGEKAAFEEKKAAFEGERNAIIEELKTLKARETSLLEELQAVKTELADTKVALETTKAELTAITEEVAFERELERLTKDLRFAGAIRSEINNLRATVPLRVENLPALVERFKSVVTAVASATASGKGAPVATTTIETTPDPELKAMGLA